VGWSGKGESGRRKAWGQWVWVSDLVLDFRATIWVVAEVKDAISVLTYVSRGTIVLGKSWGRVRAKVISNANVFSIVLCLGDIVILCFDVMGSRGC